LASKIDFLAFEAFYDLTVELDPRAKNLTLFFRTTRMAHDCLELLDHLGQQDPDWRKFHLVGLSMGGMISQVRLSFLGAPELPISHHFTLNPF
jgi:pimeloyl-ACP methyl ester carboxylesterase